MARPTVIFAHGAFCGGWAFEQFRTPFEARGLRTLTPDMRGHSAESPRSGCANLSMSDYAADLAKLIGACTWLREDAILTMARSVSSDLEYVVREVFHELTSTPGIPH